MSKPGNQQHWKLIDLDGGDEFEGEYPAISVGEEVSTSFSEVFALSREDPITQWTHGQSRQVRIEVRLFAKHSQDNIDDRLKQLKDLIKPDADLGRPHIFRFVWGTVVNERVVVEGIGGIKYDSLRNDGSLRGAVLSITMRRYTSFDIELSDPNAPPVGTRYYRAASGETYEHVSSSIYLNPHLGDLLRRRHPYQAILTEGELVICPDPRDLRYDRVEPYSIPLVRTEAFVTLRQQAFNRLNRDYISHSIRRWS